MESYLAELGSKTAKNGFKNEKEIAAKFNNWKNDIEAECWLKIMGYEISMIEYVKVVVLSGEKADLNVQIQIKLKQSLDVENIQVKLVSSKRGFNQVDKRWLKKYDELWNFDKEVYKILQYFTGEIPPYKCTKDKRGMFLNEFDEKELKPLIKWFDKNKVLILSDILKGRGEFCAEWVLVVQKSEGNVKWVLKNINSVINYFFADGKVEISPRGSLKIGKVTMQRKGGDAGRETANMLQFKIDPAEIFNIK